jgi:signal transduction histidine kinase
MLWWIFMMMLAVGQVLAQPPEIQYIDEQYQHTPLLSAPVVETWTPPVSTPSHNNISAEPDATPVPEPTSVVMFVTAFGSLLSFGIWQRRRSGHPKFAATLVKKHVTPQAVQDKHLAIMGKMAERVLHDVKNALTGIRTCAEVLEYHDLSLQDRQEFVQTIFQQVDYVVDLTREWLEFSSGQQRPFQLQIVQVSEFFQEIRPILEQVFKVHNIEFQVDVEYRGTVTLDIRQMERVFLNIAANARDAMPRGGSFTLRSRRSKDGVRFECIDSGCGMSPDLQARMFEPFVTAGKPHGTGLGMAIVKDILEQHQAHWTVRSKEGEGTAICFILPDI